jgi:hypothetical protein
MLQVPWYLRVKLESEGGRYEAFRKTAEMTTDEYMAQDKKKRLRSSKIV